MPDPNNYNDNMVISPEAASALARMGKNSAGARSQEMAKKIDLGTHQIDRQLEEYQIDNGKIKPYIPDNF